MDVSFGDGGEDSLRKDGAKHSVAVECADESVRQSVNGGWNERCNVSMGDVEIDGANECDLNDSKASKLIQAYAYGQAHEVDEDASN